MPAEPARRGCSGLSLIETMIGMAFAGFVVLAAMQQQAHRQAVLVRGNTDGGKLDLQRYLMGAINCDATLASEGSRCDGTSTIRLLRADLSEIAGSRVGATRLGHFAVKATCRGTPGGTALDVRQLRARGVTGVEPAKDPLTGREESWEPVFKMAPFLCPAACVGTLTATAPLALPANTGCPYGTADNNPATGGRYAARITQNATVPLPAFSRMCRIRFKTNAPFRYDDNFVVLYNGRIAFGKASISSAPHATDGPTRVWDWANVRGKRPPNADYPRLPGYSDNADCYVPDAFASPPDRSTCLPASVPTNSNLNLDVSLGQDASDVLGKTSAGTAQIALVVQGDDDANDCRTNGLIGTWTFDYLP